ncbi:LPP20 family lipoprotein [Seohaeicola saemankumensis]|uniref:LPP20 family lipoprotein n=1 Tax=Seohaeicola TaxID=481178 RepID=UPI0035D0A6B5
MTYFSWLSMPLTVTLISALALSACTATNVVPGPGATSTVPVPPRNAAPTTQEISRVEQVLDAADQVSVTVPTIRGMGYAVVSAQPGKNLNHRRLNAIRVARMEAMRNLTEQIHGVRIDASTTIAEAVLQSDTMRTTVVGMLRAARTVHIQPRGSDTYEVLLEVDRDMIDQMLRVARRET